MQKYVLDEQLSFKDDLNKGAARSWGEILGSGVIIITSGSEGFMRLENGTPLKLEAGVVVAHRPTEEQINAISALKKNEPRLFVLNVSGSPSDAIVSQVDWFYCVRTPLGNPSDMGFAKRFESFWADLEASNGLRPNFPLLEPTAVPASLLAYTLAVHYGLKVPKMQELCNEADTCYEKLQPFAKSLLSKGGAISFPEVNVPPRQSFEAASGDANGTRFKAMRNVIELLREDL